MQWQWNGLANGSTPHTTHHNSWARLPRPAVTARRRCSRCAGATPAARAPPPPLGLRRPTTLKTCGNMEYGVQLAQPTHSTWAMAPMATRARGVFDRPTMLVPGTRHGRATHTAYYSRPAASWRPLRNAEKSRLPTQQTLTGMQRNTSDVSGEHPGDSVPCTLN